MRKRLEQHLGRQLSKPQGFWGVLVGKLMNVINKQMYIEATKLLHLLPNDELLEIGFGNGAFIEDMVHKITPGN